ncbi:uncharacterized protein LOC131207607 [Anopheles bellator]|uniref:uncharacterized protein LOC131207607 n=1 Tax=Anopheles bellator TaxID=139047 RepID=UPI002648C522|nr:uncharacterized protein LOC131207607 [Anopheles bellator]
MVVKIKGGTTRAQWEDVTGSTPLTFVNDCVSFTTTVSARFWLMDCRNIADATKMATELYKEAIHVPFMAKFVVFAKRTDPLEARLRVFCMTDDREDKTLEHQEHFTEVAKSRDVEVLEDKPQYIELAGNLVPVTKSGEQLSLPFKAFRENRLPFAVRVKDQHADIVGRTLFMREPKIAKGEPPQQPICILNIVLPETIIPEHTTTIQDSHEILLRVGRSRAVAPPRQLLIDDQNYLGELRVVDISNLLGEDWIRLAPEIGVSETDVENIIAQIPTSTAQQAQAMLKQFQSKPNNDFNILENGLRTIHRDDIVDRCIRSATTTGTTTTVTMRNKTSFSIGKRSVDSAAEILTETDSISKMAQKDDRLSKKESTKYSVEEKTVEESEESEEELVKKTVAERRKQIEKRLSADRSIPASTQKKEIVEEIITIKRQSVIDDTRARHEEEILMQKPIDNTYKSATMPEPVVKLKTAVVKDGPTVRKDEFDQELQDKFKTTLKNVEEFEHKSEVLEHLGSDVVTVKSVSSSPRVVEELKKKPDESLPEAVLVDPEKQQWRQSSEEVVSPVPRERAPVPAKRTSLTKEPEELHGVVEESIKDVKQRISSFETKTKTETLVGSKQSSSDTTSGRDSWSEEHRKELKQAVEEHAARSAHVSEDSESELIARKEVTTSQEVRTVDESSKTTSQQDTTKFEQIKPHHHGVSFAHEKESFSDDPSSSDGQPIVEDARWREQDSEPSSMSEGRHVQQVTMTTEESYSQQFKSETVSKVEETFTKVAAKSATTVHDAGSKLTQSVDYTTTGKDDGALVREEFVARSAESSSFVDRKVESFVREQRNEEPAVEKRDIHREVKESSDKMAEARLKEIVAGDKGSAPLESSTEAYTVESFDGVRRETTSTDPSGTLAELSGTAVSTVETGVRQGEDMASEKIVEKEEELCRTEKKVSAKSVETPAVTETVSRTISQEITSKIPVPSKKASPDAKDHSEAEAPVSATPFDQLKSPVEPKTSEVNKSKPSPKLVNEPVELEQKLVSDVEATQSAAEQMEATVSKIPRFGVPKPAGKPDVTPVKSPEPDSASLSKIPILKDRKVSEQISSDSCETVICQKSVAEQGYHMPTDGTIICEDKFWDRVGGEPDDAILRGDDEEVIRATTNRDRELTEIITEDHRAVTPDDFIDEIIEEAHDKVQQLQSADVTVGTLDLSRSEEEQFDKSIYPMPEYVSGGRGSSRYDENEGLAEDEEQDQEKWKDDANSSVPDDMSSTDFEAFREYHWLDTPDATGPPSQRPSLGRTSTPIRDAATSAGVALASFEDLDTLSPLSTDMGDGRKLAQLHEGKVTVDEGREIRSSRKHFNLDLDIDATTTRTTATSTSTTNTAKAHKTITFEKTTKQEGFSHQGTSPMSEIVESPDSVHSGRYGRGDSPAIKLVIGRKEIKTSDTSAITESRLTVYGHKDVEISISSQSTISLTTTHTSKDGREKTAEICTSGGELKEVSNGKRYKQFKLIDDPDSEQTERKRDDAVSFSKKKSVYLFGSFDSSSGSPITEASVSQHVTDTGISLTKGFTETMTSPGLASSSAEEKNKKVSIITDTAVDVEIEELELTDAGLSPIQPDETDITADFQMADDDVHFSNTGTSPMDFEEPSLSVAMDTSEAATLTDRVETKDASNSPLDAPITSILKRDVSKLTDEELLTGRRGSDEIICLDDDSPLLTDFTTSSITYVSDRIDSSSLELMVGEASMEFLKVGKGAAQLEDKKLEVQSPGSCLSFTTTTSENNESCGPDVEKTVDTVGSLQPDIPTQYERSFSLSDNAASDYSTESATKYNLPYDTESDGHEAISHASKVKGMRPKERVVVEVRQSKPTKLISVDPRQETASPQSDITEYTESISCVESIIDSTNYESAFKQKELRSETRSLEEKTDLDGKSAKRTMLVPDKFEKGSEKQDKSGLKEDRLTKEVESSPVKRRQPKAKAAVTKVSLSKPAPVDGAKRSNKTTDQRHGSGTSKMSEVTVMGSKTSTVTTRSYTSTRTHGYMQSTLSRDQKVLRPLNLTDSPHSSPSKSVYRSATNVVSSTQTATATSVHSTEVKAKSTKQLSSRSLIREQTLTTKTSTSVREAGARKTDVTESRVTTKASAKASSVSMSTPKTGHAGPASVQRLPRTPTRKGTEDRHDKKDGAVVKKSDKDQANKATKSTLPAALKTSKDRVNKSLIPVSLPPGKRESVPSPSRSVKAKREATPPVKMTKDSAAGKHREGHDKVHGPKQETVVVQLVTKSAPRVTSSIRHGGKDDGGLRCKSAMHYSYKDAVTFDHAEVPSSLPSSPSRLNKSSSTSTNVLTSEVFTRTIDSSKSIEVIYKQPSTSHELYRKVNEYRYNDIDMNFIETTDSSLSDSIALPSSSSEQESDGVDHQKRSGSLGSPKQTSSSSAVTTMTTMTKKTHLYQQQQQQQHHSRPSKPHSTGGGSQRARTHSPAEPRYRMSDIWSRTDPPASSQELPDSSEDSDIQQQQHPHRQPMSGVADRRLATSLDGIVLESSISPILDFRASTPPRLKYKFDYDSSLFTDCDASEEEAEQSVSFIAGDDDEYLVLVHSEAARLVDSVLEQSVSIVSSSQPLGGPMTADRELQAPSESEQYAIRSDILSSTDGGLVVKSPTIESMSGKSFDDNMSNPEYDTLGTSPSVRRPSDALGEQCAELHEGMPAGDLPQARARPDRGYETAILAGDDDGDGDGDGCKEAGDHGEGRTPESAAASSARRAKQIERKYARLSADLGPEVLLDKNQEYDDAISQIKDEVSILQSEYSKLSWDESMSATTGDFGSSTPDNDLQETETQLQTQEPNVPKTALRTQTKSAIAAATVELDVSDAPPCGADAIASAITTATFAVATTSQDVTTLTSAEEKSVSLTATEPERPSDSSSCEGQPLPKPRTSISSRTDTATRSSLLESFEHQDSIEQYPEPVQPVVVDTAKDTSTGAKFFIGECCSDIITRTANTTTVVTAADRRLDFAFDNEGYTHSQDSHGAGTDDEPRRDAFEVYHEQVRQEDCFTLDSLKELDIGARSSTAPVVHSPVVAVAPTVPLLGEPVSAGSQRYSLMTSDELTIAKTLDEVKESLDAVQDELIEAVMDGTTIKQSPSEFELKVLPATHYAHDPIYETTHEEVVPAAAGIFATAASEKSDLSDVESKDRTEPPCRIDEATVWGTTGSSDSSQAKLDVTTRVRKGPHGVRGASGSQRWSATDVDSSGESHYQSLEHTDSSRPVSSDLENVMAHVSSEYETALEHSTVRTSATVTEYHSAVSTLHSYPVSSHDSMKSFDSESSGNLASIESDATETLVPSTMDGDFDSSDAALIHDDSEDDLRDKLLLLDDREELSSAASSIPIAMKRSHEMDFAELKHEDRGEHRLEFDADAGVPGQDEKLSSSIGTAHDLVESMQAAGFEDSKTDALSDETKLGTSVEDGSILSISLSSASNLETIMENLSERTATAATHTDVGLDAVTPTGTGAAVLLGDVTLTSTVLTEGDVNFLNTQATTEIIQTFAGAREEADADAGESGRKRGHKRTESTAIVSGKFMAEMEENRDSLESQDDSLSLEASKPSSSERDETRDESSDSDYDRYESEYARSFRAPVAQSKKKDKMVGDVFEKDLAELDRRNSFSPSQSVIETIVEDVHAETEQGDEAHRLMVSKSQRLQEYRESSTQNIPDIHVTDDVTEVGEDDGHPEDPQPEPSVRPVPDPVPTVVQYAKQEEFQLTEEQYQELIEQKYKAKLADTTTKYGFDVDEKDDSAGSDSFEMLEQPDISDEFVIVEEVAREAHEFDSEGKSVAIKPVKLEKKHDEDVEKMLVKSAPAHTNAGSLYAANMREDMMYEFEESPPTGGTGPEEVEGAGVTMDLLNNGYPLEESKRWVEMQLAETQNFRYPYEDRLEDIKEEDTDFEVGSSRIGSIKDSFSSTPDYDMLARRMASREHDDISMSSLQEFENLEHVISLENRKMQQGSQDSLSNGSFTRRFMQRGGVHGDDISLSSLKEFEGLESACIEAHLIEIKAKEEAALLLSRSDESNKSDRSNGAKRSPPTNGAGSATVVSKTAGAVGPSSVCTEVVKKTSTELGKDASLATATVTTTVVTSTSRESSVPFEEEDTSHLLTVSSDSLDGAVRAPKQALSSRGDTQPSAHSSSDSLEIHGKNNADVMTSSMDSIEFSKTGLATTRSSQSDSIEHMVQQQPPRSDSIDSIEAQHQQQQQQHPGPNACSDTQSGFSSPTKSLQGQRNVADGTAIAGGSQQHVMYTTTTTTTTVHVAGGMQKDISADSLTGPDAAFLTSTESLETSSTATNATYQNETDSQMSSSVTSCDSITMVDTLGGPGMGDLDSFHVGIDLQQQQQAAATGATVAFGSAMMSSFSASQQQYAQQRQQQQQVYRSSQIASSSATVTTASSSSSAATSSAAAFHGRSQTTDIELLSRELFPGDIAFDEVMKETAKDKPQSKSTEKED